MLFMLNKTGEMSNDVESILAFCKNGSKMTAYDLSLAKNGLILLFLTDLTDSLPLGMRG
jgi:hypothetical protein